MPEAKQQPQRPRTYPADQSVAAHTFVRASGANHGQHEFRRLNAGVGTGGGAGPATKPSVWRGHRHVCPVGLAHGSQDHCHRQFPTLYGSRAIHQVSSDSGIGTLTALNKGEEIIHCRTTCRPKPVYSPLATATRSDATWKQRGGSFVVIVFSGTGVVVRTVHAGRFLVSQSYTPR